MDNMTDIFREKAEGVKDIVDDEESTNFKPIAALDETKMKNFLNIGGKKSSTNMFSTTSGGLDSSSMSKFFDTGSNKKQSKDIMGKDKINELLSMGNKKQKTNNINSYFNMNNNNKKLPTGGGNMKTDINKFFGMNTKKKNNKQDYSYENILGIGKTNNNKNRNLEMYGISPINKNKKVNNNMNKLIPNFNMTGFNNIMKGMNTINKNTNNVLMSKNPEQIARTRIKQQQGLSPTGDFDNDKLMNMLDCNPTNPNEQGAIHKMKNLLAGRGFREDAVIPAETPVGTLSTYGAQVKPTVSLEVTNAEDKIAQEPIELNLSEAGRNIKAGATVVGGGLVKGAKAVGTGFATGVKNVWEASGAGEALAERKALSEAKIEAIKSISPQDLLTMEKEKQLARLQSKMQPQSRQSAGPAIKAGVREGLGGLSAGASSFSGGLGSLGGNNIRQMADVRVGSGFYYMGTPKMGQSGGFQTMTGVKGTGEGFFKELGMKEESEQIAARQSQQIQEQPRILPTVTPSMATPQQVQYSSQEPQEVYTPTASTEPTNSNLVYSEKSKRYVRYKRQPYKKGRQVQQVPQQKY